MDDLHTIQEILDSHKLKVTKPRVAVLEVLLDTKIPMSIQEISDTLHEGVADHTTVYRIIMLFKEQNIVREVHLRHVHIDYELVRGENHHHMVCTRCGKIEEFDCHEAENLVGSIIASSRLFATAHDHDLEIFGICHACQERTVLS